MSELRKPPFEAGERVVLVGDRGGLKRGAIGAVSVRQTIRGTMSVSPDPSGHVVFVLFDNVIGMIPTPIEFLETVGAEPRSNGASDSPMQYPM